MHCSGSSEISIIPLEILDYIDTSTTNGKKFKSDHFLVSGYVDDKRSQIIIDSFIIKHKKDYPIKFYQYDMIFYKESNKTNIKNILANPKFTDGYAVWPDLIFSYSWSNGKLVSTLKWKNGDIVSEGKIRVEDIPK